MSRAGRRQSARRVEVKQSTGRRVYEQSRVRLLCVGLFFVLCYGSVAAKLVEMMVRSPAGGAQIAVSDIDEGRETTENIDFRAEKRITARADIVDRNGELLATSLITASLFANPREIHEPKTVARDIARTLPGVDEKQLLTKLQGNKTFVWVKRNLTPVEQQAVNTLGVPGLYFVPEERRVYPRGNVFSHVVGYVGVDSKGLAGIEKALDEKLLGARTEEPLQLSVDMRVQHIMYDELQRTITQFKAIGGTGLVMDAHSGEMLAMVSLPDFDPHKPARAKDYEKFNRASLGSYEMGSTFKTFTAAMALENKVTTMKGGYDATAPLKYASFTIDDTHPKRRWLSLPEIYAYSSNIGTARMAMAVGIRRQKEFLERLGMFKPVSIELPEKATTQYPADWKEINLITISYGHGISVSPLHLMRAMGSMVNGGTLPSLTLIKQDEAARKNAQQARVISEDTSRNMRRLMRMVVQHGTASRADVVGYRVGGKTGTAEKVMAGGYSQNAKQALFVSAFPMDDPRYVVLVMVDEPQGDKSTFGYATGGWIAAPVVAKVVQRMAPMLGVRPLLDSPLDDAEEFWIDTDKSHPQSAAAKPRPNTNYLHAATFESR